MISMISNKQGPTRSMCDMRYIVQCRCCEDETRRLVDGESSDLVVTLGLPLSLDDLTEEVGLRSDLASVWIHSQTQQYYLVIENLQHGMPSLPIFKKCFMKLMRKLCDSIISSSNKIQTIKVIYDHFIKDGENILAQTAIVVCLCDALSKNLEPHCQHMKTTNTGRCGSSYLIISAVTSARLALDPGGEDHAYIDKIKSKTHGQGKVAMRYNQKKETYESVFNEACVQLNTSFFPDCITASINDELKLYSYRLIMAIVRDHNFASQMVVRRPPLDHDIAPTSDTAMNSTNLKGSTTFSSNFKDWPDYGTGISVCEFFSGIGGFRLALPKEVHGIPIRTINAYDCSAVANAVYNHNFSHKSSHNHLGNAVPNVYVNPNVPQTSSREHMTGKLHNVLIEGVKVTALDDSADIWTMSPPCQPYTTTRGAKRLDTQDKRSDGIYHLMNILVSMKKRPNYIILENVAGFVDSKAARDWKNTCQSCGYIINEYLISPHDVNIPNHRRRCYITAVSNMLHKKGTKKATENTGATNTVSDFTTANKHKKRKLCSIKDIKSEVDDKTTIDKSELAVRVPEVMRIYFPNSPLKLSHFCSLVKIDKDTIPSLIYLSTKILHAIWAPSRISIVGPHDTTSYCFTKSYGRLYDKSSGSCYLECTEGPLASPEYAIDRSQTGSKSEFAAKLEGKARLFHPKELLALSGFPLHYEFPTNMSVQKQYACIGNSINVFVVKALLDMLFS